MFWAEKRNRRLAMDSTPVRRENAARNNGHRGWFTPLASSCYKARMRIVTDCRVDLIDIGKLLLKYVFALPLGRYREKEAHRIGVRTSPPLAMARSRGE
jgi:hypothetical protein